MIINESIAEALEWGLTNLEYHTLGQKYGNYRAFNYNHADGEQLWDKDLDDYYYTPLFIDLVDDINQKTEYGGNRPNDNVEGYTLSSLESSLPFSINLFFLKLWLKSNKLDGVTNENIDELIDFYINL